MRLSQDRGLEGAGNMGHSHPPLQRRVLVTHAARAQERQGRSPAGEWAGAAHSEHRPTGGAQEPAWPGLALTPLLALSLPHSVGAASPLLRAVCHPLLAALLAAGREGGRGERATSELRGDHCHCASRLQRPRDPALPFYPSPRLPLPPPCLPQPPSALTSLVPGHWHWRRQGAGIPSPAITGRGTAERTTAQQSPTGNAYLGSALALDEPSRLPPAHDFIANPSAQ